MSWKISIIREGKETVTRSLITPTQATETMHKAIEHFTKDKQDATIEMHTPDGKLVITINAKDKQS